MCGIIGVLNHQESKKKVQQALAILKKTSSDIALKKVNREVKDGAVMIQIKDNGHNKKAVLVSLLCETDFVGRNEDFTTLLQNLTEKALALGIEEMQKEAKNMINPVIQKTGENIQLGETYEIEGDILGSYVHNNKIAVLVSLEGGNGELAKDIAMHIAAMKPEYIREDEISDDSRKTITEVFQKEVAGIDKIPEIKKKMLDGKISTYFKEKTLLSQPFIKNANNNTSETVGELLEKHKAKIKEVKRYSI